MRSIGIDPNAAPQPIPEYNPRDKTINTPERAAQINTCGSVCYNTGFFDYQLTMQSTPLAFEVKHALIFIARIGLRRAQPGSIARAPYVQTLLLANGYGNLRALFDAGPLEDASAPAGTSDYGGTRTSPAQLRRAVLERLGSINVVVGFHAGWMLTTIGLALPASRVVDLGTEELFQNWCCLLAMPRASWIGPLGEHLINLYDRRLPAVLARQGVELYAAGHDDPLLEVIYTAAIWGLLAPRIAE